jgi:luciferase family oxidoreductase group 1
MTGVHVPVALDGVRLSVLDVAPIPEGGTPGDALRATVTFARDAERLGFHRFWVAEHHGIPGIACSSPPVVVASIASTTSAIRVGAGGVMLPDHTSLVVAEQFGALEALYPDRIDLGVGRGPGLSPATAAALNSAAPDQFPRQVGDLIGFFTGQWPENHAYRNVHAIPGEGAAPVMWMLGSSESSALLAGRRGLPFAFGHHIRPANLLPALARYRQSFQPSPTLLRPYVMLAVGVVCADTDEHARYLAGPLEHFHLRLRQGMPGRLVTAQEADAYPYSDEERRFVTENVRWLSGDPERVLTGLRALLDETGADELMLITMTHDPADRLRSFQLIAEAAGRTSLR